MTSEHESGSSRLNEILAEYLQRVEAGEAVDREALLRQHAEFEDELREFFADDSNWKRVARVADSEVSPTLDVSSPDGSEVEIAPTFDSEAASDLPQVETQRVGYFGDYELLEEIARGGMGVVYKARQVNLDRVVALKMILSGQLASEADVRRFYQEAEAAANLEHPGVVPIYEIGQHEGQHFFSMAYVDGPSLAELLADGPLPSREAAQVVQQVAEAIAYAHSRGVIHRDLKPANILLQKEEGRRMKDEEASFFSLPPSSLGLPKVTDFGLAKKLEDDSGLTATGQILGTPAYMPPEQAAGNTPEVTEAADVYSLGAILYCLLVGHPPFQAANVIETIQQVLHQDPVPPRRLNEKLPLDLETICLKCLDKDRDRRYATAQSLADDLGRFGRGEPILARPIGRLERSWRWCRRNPVVASLTALAAVLLMVGTVVSTAFALEAFRQAGVAREERNAAETERERAVDAERETAKALADQRLTSYVHGIQLAHRAYLAGEFRRGGELINACPKEHRHWEWRYLWRLLRSGRTVFEGHTSEVADVAVSPDGRLVASVSWTHLRGWNPDTGEERFAVEHPKFEWPAEVERPQMVASLPGGPVRGLAFSPAGDRLALAGLSVRILDVKDRRELTQFFDPKLWAQCVAFDADGQHLAAGGIRTDVRGPNGLVRGFVAVLDVATGEVLHRFDELSSTVFSVAYSPDGRWLAAATLGAPGELPESGQLRVWNLDGAEAEPLAFPVRGKITPKDPRSAMLCVAFNADGSRLAVGRADGKVYFWDTKDWQRSALESSAEGSVRDIAFSADGKTIATIDSDHLVRLLDATTGDEIAAFRGHAHPLSAVAFSPDGKRVVSGGGYRRSWNKPGMDTQGEAIAWHVDGPQGRRIIAGEGKNLFHPDWRFVVSSQLDTASQAGNLVIYDLPSGERRGFSPPHGFAARAALARDGQLVVASTHNGGANIWNVDTGKLVARIPDGPPVGQDWYSRMVALSADGRRAATKFRGTLVLWDVDDPPEVDGVPTATEIRRFEPKWGQKSLFDVEITFTPGGKSFVLPPHYSDDKRTRLLNAETGEERFVSRPGVVFTSDGRRLVDHEGDQGFVVRSMDDGRILNRAGGEELRMGKLVLAPNDRYIAGLYRSADKSRRGVIVWDLVGKKPLVAVEGYDMRSNLVFDDAGQRFACGTQDGSLIFGDVETGNGIVSRGYNDYVAVVAISHDGRRVASTGMDGTVRIWDAQSGRELLTFVDPNPDPRYIIQRLAFGPRDHWLATQGPPLLLWDGRPIK